MMQPALAQANWVLLLGSGMMLPAELPDIILVNS